MTKPPMGLVSREIYESIENRKRIVDIIEVIIRYYDAGKPAEIEWFIELLERTRDMPCRVEVLTIFKGASQGEFFPRILLVNILHEVGG